MSVLDEVAAERARQDTKWGEQNHDPQDFFAILSEEVGEVAKEVVEWRWARTVGHRESLDEHEHRNMLDKKADDAEGKR